MSSGGEGGPRATAVYEFGPFRLDPTKRLLLREGQPLPLTPKAFDLLRSLVENRGRVLEKDELMRLVWPDTAVEEANLTQNVFTVRKALGEGPNDHRYIATMPRRGYQFVAEVHESPADSPEAAAVAQPRKFDRRGIRVAAAVGVVALLGGLWWRQLRLPAGQPTRKVMVAVLPFVDLSADHRQEYFSDGMTEEMITQLGQLQSERLGIIARTSTMRYKATKQDVKQIGRELGVAYILEGSVRREADRVRVSAQLIQVSDQTHLWAQSYDRAVRDVLSLEHELSGAIAEQIGLKLSPATNERPTRARTVDPEAYDAYLKGRYFLEKRTEDGISKAGELFRAAVRKDPAFPPAYAGMSEYYLFAGNFLFPTKEALPKAEEAALKAIELDASLAESHTSLALVRQDQWNLMGAEREFQRSLELNPNDPRARLWYGTVLLAMGRYPDAVRQAEQARDLDPMSMRPRHMIAWASFFGRDYDRAIARYRELLEMDGASWPTFQGLGCVHIQKAMYEQAIPELEKAVELSGRNYEALTSLGYGYGRAGRRADALRLATALSERWNAGSTSAYCVALVHAGMGNADEAFAWLQRAYAAHDELLVFLSTDPRLDSIRSDPRLRDLVRRVGLPAVPIG